MAQIVLNETNIKEFENATSLEMDKAVKHFERELITIRTGRAHPALVEGIKVDAYGSTMGLKELAAVSVPEPRSICIQPWDQNLINDIEKAIKTSDLGVTPINDGNLIRIQLPEMSSARRDELGKILGKKLEDARIAIRNSRKDFHNLIRDAKANKSISEDHANRLSELLQKITDKFTKLVEQMAQKKEQEIKTV